MSGPSACCHPRSENQTRLARSSCCSVIPSIVMSVVFIRLRPHFAIPLSPCAESVLVANGHDQEPGTTAAVSSSLAIAPLLLLLTGRLRVHSAKRSDPEFQKPLRRRPA